MTRRVTLWTVLVAASLMLAGALVSARQAPSAGRPVPPLTQKLGVDPAIATGVLPNGLRYYVRANKTPEHRAELRLVVNAGSVLEDDSQRGYAHLVEHMTFEGTRNFPRAAVTAFMQSLGMGIGAHLNATTTFDDTVYQLQVPTDRGTAVTTSLQILRDWAHDVMFDSAAVDRERQIVTEEWRQGLGAAERIADEQRPVLLQGSRYAVRLPIGQMDTVQSATPAQLRTFYTDWYRPDLMAVIVVGDVDRTAIVNFIGQTFGTLTNPSPERPRPLYPVPDVPGTRFSIVSDREATTTTVSSYVLAPATDGSTVGGYKQQLAEQIFSALLNARFDELARRPEAPFVAAAADRSLFVSGEQASILTALVPETGISRGLETMLAEVQRVTRDGFTATELDRVKANATTVIDRVLAQKDTRQSSAFAAEYVRAFTTNEALPSLEDEMALRGALLKSLTVANVNALAPTWSPDRNRTIAVSTGQKAGVVVPDQTALTTAIAMAAQPLPKYVDAVVSVPLLETPPTPGRVLDTAAKPQGITEWVLSNGVKVILKPTTFIEDEILFRAFAFGGTSLASDSDLVAAQTASTVVSVGGLGHLSALELDKVLTGKTAHADPYITTLTEGLSGGSTRRDLETLLQLIYLRFTAPRVDPVAFGVVQAQLKTLLANQQSQPEAVLAQAVTRLMTQNNPRSRPLSADAIGTMNMNTSLSFYRERFADASGFTFVFVGSFDPETLRPLVERYLGALPATRRGETWRDEGIRFPPTVAETTVEKGVDPKSEVAIVFAGSAAATPAHQIQIQALARVLQGRLFGLLRQQLGGTYGVQATAAIGRIPTSEYTVTIRFGCDPARTSELTARLFDDIAALKQNGPSRAQVSDIVQSFQRDFETNSHKNAWVLGEIAQAYEASRDASSVFALPDLYNAISTASIQDAAATYLDTAHYVKATLVPEKKH
jgi:zinc protease